MKRKILSLVCGMAFVCLAVDGNAGTFSIIGADRWASVAYVYDGDTFRTKKGEKVRLLGLNTPEITHGAERGQVMGQEAKKALTHLISGKIVRMTLDEQHRDVYGRLLAQVYLKDGTWVNGRLVEQGFAHVYTFPPNLRWAFKLLSLEKSARATHSGIWGKRRFAVLHAKKVSKLQIGEFHLVRGTVSHPAHNGFGFRMVEMKVSIPRAYRAYFKGIPRVHAGDRVLVHGVIRAGSSGTLYLAVHSPDAIERE